MDGVGGLQFSAIRRTKSNIRANYRPQHGSWPSGHNWHSLTTTLCRMHIYTMTLTDVSHSFCTAHGAALHERPANE